MLAASYVFYAAWDWKFLGLIMLSSVANASFVVLDPFLGTCR